MTINCSCGERIAVCDLKDGAKVVCPQCQANHHAIPPHLSGKSRAPVSMQLLTLCRAVGSSVQRIWSGTTNYLLSKSVCGQQKIALAAAGCCGLLLLFVIFQSLSLRELRTEVATLKQERAPVPTTSPASKTPVINTNDEAATQKRPPSPISKQPEPSPEPNRVETSPTKAQPVSEPLVTIKAPEIKFEPKFEPKIVIPEAPPKKSVDLILRSVSLASTKVSGAVWDNSGPPDLRVSIRIQKFLGGASFDSSVKHDVFSATFNEKTIRVSEGDTIEIEVYDEDLLASDLAGSYVKLITADTMQQRQVNWSFDQVNSLVLEFQP